MGEKITVYFYIYNYSIFYVKSHIYLTEFEPVYFLNIELWGSSVIPFPGPVFFI